MSYDDDPGASLREQKKKTDMLARIACKALAELEKGGQADSLLSEDKEVRTWWEAHKIADAKAQAKRLEEEERARVKKEALAKLSPLEKKVLGIK
jgi:phage terminase Nu1 subunit (DNA packaging protein)